MKRLCDLIPDPATLKRMHASEIGGCILECLCSLPVNEIGMKQRLNFLGHAADGYTQPGVQRDDALLTALAEGWAWLEVNLLIVKDADRSPEWYVVTPRGLRAADAAGVQRLMKAEQLPPAFLHPALRTEALTNFLQRRFDTAVFNAFHTLEVEIREAAHFGHEKYGTKLASEAFDPKGGPLTDMSAEPSERQALMNLMVGAIGSYKNPQSHRRVELDAESARELLIFASHLLKIVDARVPAIRT